MMDIQQNVTKNLNVFVFEYKINITSTFYIHIKNISCVFILFY